MKYISTILVCAGLWPAATVCAQNGGEKDSTLNRTVVVENQYNPEVMDAFKVNVMPEVEEAAKANAAKTGGSFTKTNSMAEAFKDADIVYPKSWAPFAAMEKRTNLYAEGDADGI